MSHGLDQTRRNSIRQTWLNDVPKDIDVKFFVGDINCSDAINLPCLDDYQNCYAKQFEMIKQATEYDYVFFCDDDTYIVIDRLLKSDFEQNDYQGFPLQIEDEVVMAQGGAGFWLSNKAIKLILEIGIGDIKTIYSDRLVARILHGKIPLKGDYRFNMGKYCNNVGFCNLTPNLSNQYITAHYVKPDKFKEIYEHFKLGKEISPNGYSMNFFGFNIDICEFEGKWIFISRDLKLTNGVFEMAHEAELSAFNWCKSRLL